MDTVMKFEKDLPFYFGVWEWSAGLLKSMVISSELFKSSHNVLIVKMQMYFR